MLESHRDIANATLQGGCVSGSWKREIMFPIENVEGTEKIERHRPIMLIEAYRNACTGILMKRVRKVWDTNNTIRSCNSGFARGASTAESITTLRMCIDQALRRGKPLFKRGGPE